MCLDWPPTLILILQLHICLDYGHRSLHLAQVTALKFHFLKTNPTGALVVIILLKMHGYNGGESRLQTSIRLKDDQSSDL